MSNEQLPQARRIWTSIWTSDQLWKFKWRRRRALDSPNLAKSSTRNPQYSKKTNKKINFYFRLQGKNRTFVCSLKLMWRWNPWLATRPNWNGCFFPNLEISSASTIGGKEKMALIEFANIITNLLLFWKIWKPVRRIWWLFLPAMDRIGVHPATTSCLRQLKTIVRCHVCWIEPSTARLESSYKWRASWSEISLRQDLKTANKVVIVVVVWGR